MLLNNFDLSHFWFLSSYRLGGGVGWVGSAGDLIKSGVYSRFKLITICTFLAVIGRTTYHQLPNGKSSN